MTFIICFCWSGKALAQSNQTVIAGNKTTTISFPTGACTYKWTNDNPAIGLPASGGGDIAPFTATNIGTNPIVAHITAIPVAAQFAYITNDHDNTISVINTISNSVIKTISVGSQPHGVTVSPDGKKVYVTNGNNVSVIDVATNAVVKVIVGVNAINGITLSPDGSKLYVPNTKDGFAVVDTNTDGIIADVIVQNACTNVAVTPDGNTIYATGFGTTLSVIDAATLQVKASIPISNLSTYIIASPDGKFMYLSDSSSGQIVVISTATNTIVNRFTAGNYPGETAISKDGSTLYVSNNYANNISVINTSTGATINKFNCSGLPDGISLTQDGQYLYVAITAKNQVQVFDTQTGNNAVAAIPVGLSPTADGNFITPPTQTNCAGGSVSFTITVYPTVNGTSVVATGNLSPLTTSYGTYSATEEFTVIEAGITSGVVVTAPEGFEVSTDRSNYYPSVTGGVGGNGLNEVIYIRLKATAAVGMHAGNIVVSSAAAPDFDLPMATGTVTPAQLTVTADNQKRGFGVANLPLTFTYSGFVNGENASVIMVPPTITTTATIASPKGNYPITVSGGLATNYLFNYVDGLLTVTAPAGSAVSIPNAFTPNGDGINDTWNIANMDIYPQSHVQIFNRYGTLLYNSVGYAIPWNGTAKNVRVPDGVYYYLISLSPEDKPVAGSLAVIR